MENVLPGDEIAIDVYISNASTVTAKYRTEALLHDVVGDWKVTIDGVGYQPGAEATSLWRTLAAKTNPEKPVRVTVALSEEEENQNAACNISCVVKAVQGNAKTTDSVLEAFDFSDESQKAAFCPDCYNGKPCDGTHASAGLTIENGVAKVTKEGAWVSRNDLNWAECYYQFGYDVDVSSLADGKFIAFDQGETTAWGDMHLGIKNEGGKYYAYNTLKESECTAAKLLGEVAAQFRVVATFKQAGEKFLQSLFVSGLGEGVVTREGAVSNPGICWDVYMFSEGAAFVIDNFEFAELSGTFAGAEDINGALKNNTTTVLVENVGTVEIPDGLQNATIEGNGNAINKFVVAAGTDFKVTLKNVAFTADESNSESAVYLNQDSLTGKVVFENCTFEGYTKAVSVGGKTNLGLSVTFEGCTFECGKTGTKTYGFQGFTEYKDFTLKNCTFNDCVSWAILIQGNFGEENPVLIENCTFNNCQSGLFKTTGTVAKFTFKNNTVLNSQGHDGKPNEFFAGNLTKIDCTGNTKDGAEWLI